MESVHNNYYKSLDGLRFLAFFMVFVFHSFARESSNVFFINIFFTEIRSFGFGVDLFFILSGFLITVLLLKERDTFKTVSLRYFYIRRALRIWPLYYLALIMSLIIVPLVSYFILHTYNDPKYFNQIKDNLIYYLFFMGNWSMIINGFLDFRNIQHLWTISVEQQFYLLLPFLILPIKKVRIAFILATSLIFISITTRFYLATSKAFFPDIFMNTIARLDPFALGILIGFIFLYTRIFNNNIFKNNYLILICFGVLTSYIYNRDFQNPNRIFDVTLGYTIVTLLMSYLLVASLQKTTFLHRLLSNSYLVYLGKISYGLYVWHVFMLNFTIVFLSYCPTWFSALIAFILTILVSHYSYYFFEVRFLKIKRTFTKIESRLI